MANAGFWREKIVSVLPLSLPLFFFGLLKGKQGRKQVHFTDGSDRHDSLVNYCFHVNLAN